MARTSTLSRLRLARMSRGAMWSTGSDGAGTGGDVIGISLTF